MIRRHPRSTRTDTLFPYTTLFRSRETDDPDRSKPVMLASGVEHDLEGADRHDEQDQADDIDPRLGAFRLERRQQGEHAERTHCDTGQVDEEYPRPGSIVAYRSEERCVVQACVRPCRTRRAPFH